MLVGKVGLSLSEDLSTVFLLKCLEQKSAVVSGLIDQLVKKHPDFTLPTSSPAGPSSVKKKGEEKAVTEAEDTVDDD